MNDSRTPTGPAALLLTVAAVLVGLESLAYAVLAVLDLADVSGERLGLGVGAALLLLAYAMALAVAAALVQAGRPRARAPLVVAQLIQLLLAWDALSAAAWITPALAIPAVGTLVCLLAPPVTRSLSADDSM